MIQGTDTIEESAFILDLLVGGDRPVVMTGAMRGADAPGADGPANLLAAARVAASPEARGLGTLVVLNYDIHAARFVQKAHTALPSAFASPLVGPLGLVAEGRPRFFARSPRNPVLAAADGPPAPVALVKVAMGDDGRMLAGLPGLGSPGVVVEGMGAGHVHADMAPLLGDLAARIPVVLASRPTTGPVFTAHLRLSRWRDRPHRPRPGSGRLPVRTEGPAAAGLVLAIRGGAGTVAAAFAPYQ